tara:strand:+ start:716 stop:1261 length:546 start_codon:yes stop_codon:yes gene_type:complete
MEGQSLSTKDALMHGLIIGLIQVVLTLLIYVFGVEYLTKWWLSLIVLTIFLVTLVISGKKFRSANNGVATLKEMFGFLIVTFLSAFIISTIFNIVLHNVIDPGLALQMKEILINDTVSLMERFGGSDDDIDEAVSRFATFEQEFTPLKQLMGIVWAPIWGGIIVLIISASLKKSRGIFDEE